MDWDASSFACFANQKTALLLAYTTFLINTLALTYKTQKDETTRQDLDRPIYNNLQTFKPPLRYAALQ